MPQAFSVSRSQVDLSRAIQFSILASTRYVSSSGTPKSLDIPHTWVKLIQRRFENYMRGIFDLPASGPGS